MFNLALPYCVCSAGGAGYKASITHYLESSTEVAGGAVQPGSVEDLQSIVSLSQGTTPYAPSSRNLTI